MATQNISGELAEGIKAYDVRIAPLLGQRVQIKTRDGKVHVGRFGEVAKCQPIVTDDAGKRFAVPLSELDRLVAEVSS